MLSNTVRLLFILSLLNLSGCKTDISPEWETYHSQAQTDESRVQWLSTISVDRYGDILSAGSTIRLGTERQKNILVVKHDADGNTLWASEYDLAQGGYRSDDQITDMVLDDEGNAYVVGVSYIIEREEQRYGSFIMKIDHDGAVEWLTELSAHEDARDIELKNDLLYVTGFSTQVFYLDGQRRLTVDHDKAWDIEVDDNGYFYVVGSNKAQKYSERGDLIWNVDLRDDLSLQASLSLQQDGAIVIANNHDDRSTWLSSISSDGNLQWSKNFQPARQSNGIPGPAIVKTDWRGDIILSASNDLGRRIIKLSDSGNEQWQVTSTGIVQDLVLGDDGAVYATGGGINEKYDSNGELLASTEKTSGTQVTTGSVAIDGDNMYLGYSASNNGDIDFYLAKFINE